MRKFFVVVGLIFFSVNLYCLEPIKSVKIGKNREFIVNGKVFFPIMLWLQSEKRINDGLSIGVNTFVGNGGRLSNKEYLDMLGKSGIYGVVHFDPEVINHPYLLGWIHSDEPDLTKRVYDIKIIPGKNLIINRRTPLERIVDGNIFSWSVLDPLQDAEITIPFKKSCEIVEIGIALTVSGNLSVAKDVVFIADNKREILKVTLEEKRGLQRFKLKEPVKIEKSLTFKVLSIYKHKNVWGSIGEITAYNKDGENVLLSPPRQVPRILPEKVKSLYQEIKGKDPAHPVFLNFTANFMKEFKKYDEETKKKLYPEYVKGCDVVGFDIYPIFGWNKPQWLTYVAKGVSQLTELAGKRPVFAWIETNKGSRWITPKRQLDVKPVHTRAEVWMAIIRGATAIGYFTHRWVPNYKQFAPTPEMRKELKRLNSQITRLAPAILAESANDLIEIKSENNAECHFKATRYNGKIWIFVQNLDLKNPTTIKISIKGQKIKNTADVVDEGRSIQIKGNEFSDKFEPLQEHIYSIQII